MSTCNESSGIDDESSTSTRTFSRDVPSFLEPRDPSIINPWMRPRPTHGTNLCHLFEEESYELEKQHLKVYLRVKPVNTEFSDMYHLESDSTLKTLHLPLQVGGKKVSKESILYKFTHIFNKSNQVTVFNKMIKTNLKEYIFNGRDFTLMTYGASGSGKTYSLMGIGSQPGIIPRCLEFLFQQVSTDTQPRYKPDDKDGLISLDASQQNSEIKKIRGIVAKCKDTIQDATYLTQYRRMSTALSRASQEWKKANEEHLANTYCEVWVSFAEIYNEFVHDLLEESNGKDPPTRLKLIQPPDHKPYVKGLNWVCVRSGMEAFSVLTRGRGRLRYANTNVNATSSRSHCIFTMKLIMYHDDTKTSKISTFRLCDLAGLERAKMTENRGERLNESKRINSSLHVLEKCLQALKSKQGGQQALPPYRESKLTALLQNALSGKENITMLVTINPEKKFFDETQHVLRFSALAQELLVDVQSKSEVQMSRHYSDIVSDNNSLSMSHQDVLRLLDDVKRRQEEVEQREWNADDREAELEKQEAEVELLSEQWEEKERCVRAEVAAKFMNIQEKIYSDCNTRIEQEKQILIQEHNLQISRWNKHTKELESEVKKLRQENKQLMGEIQELEALVQTITKGSNNNDMVKSSKRPQSCNTEILNTTQEITCDSRMYAQTTGISDISIIPHANTEDTKYDDFLKDFAKIDVSKDDHVNETVTKSTKCEEFGNKTVAPVGEVAIEEMVINTSMNAEPNKSEAKVVFQPESSSRNCNVNENCVEPNKTLDTSNVCKQVDKSKSLLFDVTDLSVCQKADSSSISENTTGDKQPKQENEYVPVNDGQKYSVSNNSLIKQQDNIKEEPPSDYDKIREINKDSPEHHTDVNYSGTPSCENKIGETETCVTTTDKETTPENDRTENKVELKNKSLDKTENITDLTRNNKSIESDNDEKPRMCKKLRSRKIKTDETQTADDNKSSSAIASTDFESASDSLQNTSNDMKSCSDSLNNCHNVVSGDSTNKSESENILHCNGSLEDNGSHGPRTRKQLKLKNIKHDPNNLLNGESKTPPSEDEKGIEIQITETEKDGEEKTSSNERKEYKSNVLKDTSNNINPNRGLPLPENYYTAKKDKKANELAKENCQSLCLSSRRKLFTRRHMDELAAEPQPPPQSARCLFFGMGDETNSPDPNKPPEVPRPYTYQRPPRATRQKKK